MSTISRRTFVQSIGAATLAPGVLLASSEGGAAPQPSAPSQGGGGSYADYKHIRVTRDSGVARLPWTIRR